MVSISREVILSVRFMAKPLPAPPNAKRTRQTNLLLVGQIGKEGLVTPRRSCPAVKIRTATARPRLHGGAARLSDRLRPWSREVLKLPESNFRIVAKPSFRIDLAMLAGLRTARRVSPAARITASSKHCVGHGMAWPFWRRTCNCFRRPPPFSQSAATA